MKSEGGGEWQCSMIERSANVDEAAAATATAASCSCTLGAALMSCSRMNQSSTAAATPTFPALPPSPPLLPHTTISRLWGQWYGMVGGVAWR